MIVYEQRVMECIRKRLGLEKDDTSRDKDIMSRWSPKDAFSVYVGWRLGYNQWGEEFWEVMESIKATQASINKLKSRRDVKRDEKG